MTGEDEAKATSLVGDSYGALNTLFSGLAFFGVILAIFLQSRELKLQRGELAATRRIYSEQQTLTRRQIFDTKFANLISSWRNSVNTIAYQPEGRQITLRGQEAISFIDSQLKTHLAATLHPNDEKDLKSHLSIEFDALFSSFDRRHGGSFEQSIRLCFEALEAIDRSTLLNAVRFTVKSEEPFSLDGQTEKQQYASYTRSHLSVAETHLLMCFAIREGKVALVDKYDMLKHLPLEDVDKREYGELFNTLAARYKGRDQALDQMRAAFRSSSPTT